MLEIRRATLRGLAAVARSCDRRPPTIAGARRILVCATGGLGNAILALPLLRSLRAGLPGTEIELMLSARSAAVLAEAAGWADRVFWHPEDDWSRGLSSVRLFAGPYRRRRYDAVLRTFLSAPAMSRASLAVFLSGARVRVAYGEPGANAFETHILTPDPARTEVEWHLALAGVLGLPLNQEFSPLEVPAAGRTAAAAFLAGRGLDPRTPLLGIHPGCDAAFAAKRWPADRFARVADWAAANLGVRPVVIGGPDDREVVERIAAAAPGAVIAQGQGILETAGLIERCALFLSNDSGLMHLASALDVPTLAIFGPTDPVRARPLGPRTRILRLGLDCSPCSKEMARHLCGHHDCLETLGVDRVRAAIEDLARAHGVGLAAPVARPADGGGIGSRHP